MKKIEITNQEDIDNIIRNTEVCTLSMVDNNMPYAVPMNFGYINGEIILHSAPTGKKFDILDNNNNVCLCFYTDEKLNIRHENVACSYSMRFRSVLAFGKIYDITDLEEKRDAMNQVMKQYTNRDDFKYNDPAIKGVRLMKVKVDKFTAFNRGYNE